MAKAPRERVGKQYTGTQRTRKAVHGECTVELAKWTFPIISLAREPYEVKVSRTGLTGGMGRRTVRQRALCLPSKATYMAKDLRERVGKQYKGTQRTRKAVHGNSSVELAKWTFPIISLSREPYEVKASRTGLTGGLGKRAVR
jgi:hypothetical protein